MLNTMRELGEILLEKSEDDKYQDTFIQDPKVTDILLLLFKLDDNSVIYEGIDHEEYNVSKIKKYLYRRGSSRGPNLTPSSKVTNVEKTLTIKIIPALKNIISYLENIKDEKIEYWEKMNNVIMENKQQIIEDIHEKMTNDKNKSYLLSIALIENGKKKYVGDITACEDILINQTLENYYKKYGVESRKENSICSLCLERKDKIFGFVSTFTFSSFDKPGFVSGGFKQEDAWKNYPVCKECAVKLEIAKKYIEEKLLFRFERMRYYLIPKFIDKSKAYEILAIIENSKREITIINKLKKEGDDEKVVTFKTHPIYTTKGWEQITSDDDEILYKLGEQKNNVIYNFLFFKEKQSAFQILLLIEEVPPSRIKELFQAKKDVESNNIFTYCKEANKQPEDFEFTFGIIRNFLPYVSQTRTYNKNFLEVVNNVFLGQNIEYNFIIKFIASKIQDYFKSEYNFGMQTLMGYYLLEFLRQLNLLNGKNKGGSMETIYEQKPVKEREIKIEDFFNSQKDFFNSPMVRVIFLMGVLTKFLLNIQYQERKVTPFRKKLKNLKLTESDIRKLFPEIIDKLEQYDKNYYKDLESIISEYFIRTPQNWKMTTDEISFYFSLGMSLAEKFKISKEGEQENE